MCMRHTPASEAATASSAPGELSALMSLIIAAPAPIAARITSGFVVSTEMGTGQARSPSSTGINRDSSCSADTLPAPGRLDSAPTSTRSAPSSTSRCACAIAAPGSRLRPPSENESGVTLTTPATSGRSSISRNLPQRRLRAVVSADMKRPEAGPGAPFPGNELRDGCGLGRAGRPRLRRLLRRLRGLGRARRPAVHDVLDLLGVDGFQLEQGLGHGFDLVAVVEDELPRQAVLLVDDLADLGVDLLHRHFGHVLVGGDRASEEHFPLVLAVDHRAHRVRHAPLSHHAAG